MFFACSLLNGCSRTSFRTQMVFSPNLSPNFHASIMNEDCNYEIKLSSFISKDTSDTHYI